MKRLRRISLHTHKIKITYRKKVQDPETGELLMGLAEPNLARIAVATHDPITMEPLPETVIRHSLFHEICHMAFHFAGRQDLYEDEALVDLVGGLFAQATQEG